MTETKSPHNTPDLKHPIIFFDGVCAMCNKFVDIIIRVDTKGIFRFAPLQGTTARDMLPAQPDNPQEWSMIYLDGQRVHDQSDASLRVYQRLGGAWRLLSFALILPRFIRNPVYRFIAKNRYRWFGRKDSCRIPTKEEQSRFLP
jgi:predicted DCC family thiol-disulfide oxidoreductase YuxK